MNSNWNPDDRQLYVDANDPGNANGNLGLRLSRSFTPMRRLSFRPVFFVLGGVSHKTGSQIFNPTAQHLAGFLEIFFGFDVLCLVYESIFQRESEKNFQDFDFGIGFQKICLLEIFWLGIPENGQLDRCLRKRQYSANYGGVWISADVCF